jgi:hypothetical protein
MDQFCSCQVSLVVAGSCTLSTRCCRDEPEFCDTLDYIFISKQIDVKGVKTLLHSRADGPQPTLTEPSDHLMLAADLVVLESNKKKSKPATAAVAATVTAAAAAAAAAANNNDNDDDVDDVVAK